MCGWSNTHLHLNMGESNYRAAQNFFSRAHFLPEPDMQKASLRRLSPPTGPAKLPRPSLIAGTLSLSRSIEPLSWKFATPNTI
ncbi:hypothetical protein CIHG_02522 [Coccidioides immitis H538.4]|uniref:Uncharacterized protein n=2 Tax=Coccidioides immitis TaxID=5501 RepID=A0A0J8RLC9_COCIT|nr:hypothetical protein CIRG_02855 [Coccidioides immitis RMSCC 2394]KMU84739.1 hypothetical protein CIHG_02522 [Coccidioides immitis H538.4]